MEALVVLASSDSLQNELEAVSKPLLAKGWLGLTGTDAQRWSANPQKTAGWGLTSFDPSHPTP
ncbi:MAG: hypothetical protein A2W31_00260 [Planctomycetes bacterium RBG_16_64_10]|nr:MAG: hypothetical protein A2W31_00260 [Planctomycetes bacterium RBG_16_64_10]